MAYIVMAYIAMACIVMAPDSYGRYVDGLDKYEESLKYELPHKEGVWANLISMRVMMCDWEKRREDIKMVRNNRQRPIYLWPR